MDQELKQKWITALRSEDYEQGSGKLRPTDDRYCCLGVLVDVADPEGWNRRTEDGYVPEYWYYKHEYGLIDIEDEGILQGVLRPSDMDHLAEMNDKGVSFPEIADWIEEYL